MAAQAQAVGARVLAEQQSTPAVWLRNVLFGAYSRREWWAHWWAHFEFTRINTTPTILPKKIEDQLVLGANC
jgi:hypothetical protein